MSIDSGPGVVGPVRFADVGELQVAFRVEGSAAPVLVLLHGFSSNQDSWTAVTAALADRHRVVTYDRPGFGLTRLPEDVAARRRLRSPAGEVSTVLGLLDHLGVEQAVLVGHSMGGAIAAEVTLAAPTRVLGLVLEDAAIGPSFGPRPFARRVAAHPAVASVGPRVTRAAAPRAYRFFLPLIYDDPSRVSPEIRASYGRMVRQPDWSTSLFEMAGSHESSDLADRVGDIEVATLVLTGDRDRIVAPDTSFDLARSIPDSHLVIVPRCGHSPHEEQPRDFVASVLPFLGDLAAEGG